MLRRTAFKAKAKAPAPQERAPRPFPSPARRVAPTVFTELVLVQPKENAIVSEAYRRLVAAMPCKVCGIQGFSQAAHPNTGKGQGIKTDDRLCFALCCDRPGVQGCHPKFDQGAMYPRHVRRLLEPAWAADTQRQIQARGQWPENLPLIEQAP